MKEFFDFSTKSPLYFERALQPVAGDLRVRPAKKAAFESTVNTKQLSKLAIFTVYANSIKVNIAPPHSYIGLHLPLGKPFIITENSQASRFQYDIHLLRSDRTLSLEASEGCRVLVTNIYWELLQDYALKMLPDKPRHTDLDNRIEISSPTGLSLVRSLANLWSTLCRIKSASSPNMGILELEDALLARFVMATETRKNNRRRSERMANVRAITRAEEYLNAHLTQAVSRADLASAACTSIRTLSRGFTRRHGVGPMGFLKARRLDAIYRELLGAEADSISVTEIAVRYGFNHLGKFAVEYKQTFGESPSVTLSR